MLDEPEIGNGLGHFQDWLAGRISPPPICSTIGMRLLEAEIGKVTFASTPDEGLLNGFGFIHGGYALTLLDSSMSCAVHSSLKPAQRYVTLEVKTNFTRGIHSDTGELFCEGNLLTAGRTIATAEGVIRDGGGNRYAHGLTTCLIMDENS